jgi:hypothetical protein
MQWNDIKRFWWRTVGGRLYAQSVKLEGEYMKLHHRLVAHRYLRQGKDIKPRLDYIDLDLTKRVLAGREEFIEKFEENERLGRHYAPQTSYSLVVADYLDNAFNKYALGEPLEDVRAYLVKAATYMGRVFELRGTQPPFPVTVFTTDAFGKVVDKRPLHPEGAVDFSTTNPIKGLRGLYLALIVGNMPLAQHIAELMWDPEDADYIGLASEICTPDEQHLAYAVKHLVLKDDQAALAELAAIKLKSAVVRAFGSQRDVKRQVAIVSAIVQGERAGIVAGLHDLIGWHTKVARQEAQRKHPEFFFSLPGLGLLALAMAQGLVEDISIQSVHLPIELITPMQTNFREGE